MIDFSVMPNLRELKVEDDCFKNVEEVMLIGMKKLESVLIGENCFSRNGANSIDEKSEFCLRECNELSKLKIGNGSFRDYSLCEIIDSKALEVIDLGNGDNGTSAFYYSSLTLKNLPELDSLHFGKLAFSKCTRVELIDLAALTTIQLESEALRFKGGKRTELVMKNLPKLKTVTSSDSSFVNPHFITLEDMPLLSTLNLDTAFIKDPVFRTLSNIGAFSRLPTVPYRMDHVNMKCIRDLESLYSTVTEIVVGCYCCNDRGLTSIDFSGWKQVKSVKVGMASFKYAANVSFVDMPELESICLDCRSFTQCVPYYYTYCEGERESDSDICQSSDSSILSDQQDSGAFIVTRCSKLNSISIHNKACLNFTKCEIRHNQSLSTIRIDRAVKVLASDDSLHGYEPDQTTDRGGIHEEAGCFAFRNCRTLAFADLPQLKRFVVGKGCFFSCRYATFRNLPRLRQITFEEDALYHCKDLLFFNLPELKWLQFYSGSSHFGSSEITVTLKKLDQLKGITDKNNEPFDLHCKEDSMIDDFPFLEIGKENECITVIRQRTSALLQ
ncbi:hypothetical protein WA577_007133 [Blastocystis sp. JDR]